MVNSYQNSVIAQILEAIIDSGTYDGATNSEIADILLSILNETPYEKEPTSVIAELFLKVKAKIEGESYEPYDKPYISRIAEILISILNESEYTNAPNSKIAELLLELKEALESYTEVTTSGAICSFITNVAKPLVSLKTNIDYNAEGVSAVSVYQLGGNLFNKDNVTTGKLINGAGNEVTYSEWNISDYIPVIEGASYYLFGLTIHPNTQQDNFELFDASKIKTGYANVKTYDQPYTIPEGVKYVKFSLNDVDLAGAQFGVAVTSYEAYNPTINDITIDLSSFGIYGGFITLTPTSATLTSTKNADGTDKPVGLVWLCCGTAQGSVTYCMHNNFPTDVRENNRRAAADRALRMVIEAAEKKQPTGGETHGK